MKWRLINTIPKRIGFAIVLGFLIQFIMGATSSKWSLNPTGIFILSCLSYIPVTIFWAVVSTFFTKEDEGDDFEVLDDNL